jgi:hypothetical protein
MTWQHRLPELAVGLKDFAMAGHNGAAEPKRMTNNEKKALS